MFRFAATDKEALTDIPVAAPAPVGLLSFPQILARVELRLRWYGFSDWRIRDVVSVGTTVSVQARDAHGNVLAFTVARDGGAMTCVPLAAPPPKAVIQAPAKAVAPSLARTLGQRAMGALLPKWENKWGPSGRFLSRPALCEG